MTLAAAPAPDPADHIPTAPTAADHDAAGPLALERVLAAQAGLITREQAVAAGVPAADIDQRVRLRRWRPVQPRVYRVVTAGPGRPAGPHPDAVTRTRAALLWAGPRAALSGPSAAWWHGLTEVPPALPTVTVGPAAGRRCRGRAGVGVRCRELAPVDVTVLRGLPVTALPLTVLDAAVALGPAGPEFLDRALRDRVRFAAVREAHRRMHGTPGWARAGLLLEAAVERSAVVAARRLARLLHVAGTGGWVFDPPTAAVQRPARIVFPGARVWVELSGWARLSGPGAAPKPGWKVLRYTWHDLVERPTIVVAEIAGTVGAGQPGGRSVILATRATVEGRLGEQARPATGYPEL